MEIIKKYDDTYIFEEEGVRFFLLLGDNKALLIDTGMSNEDISKELNNITDKEIILVNTHCDIDHIGKNYLFDKVYMGIHEIYHYENNKQEILGLFDKDIIELGNREIEIIDIPGHTRGSIALLDKRHKILFSGDSIQEDGRIFMFGSERNLEVNIQSLNRLKKRINEFDEIWPCHCKLPVYKDMIDDVIEDCELILKGESEYKEVDLFGNKVKAHKMKRNTFLTD